MENRKDLIKGIIDKLLNQESALSFSSLKDFADSPKDFIDYKLLLKEETDAMKYGSLVHCLLLEPDKFEERYVVFDDADLMASIGGAKPRATKAYKEQRDIFHAENQGKIILDVDTYNQAKFVQINALNNRAVKAKLDGLTQKEFGVEWDYQNFKFRGYIDGQCDKYRVDIKTCVDAKPRKFGRDIMEKRLYLQAAMYEVGSGIRIPHYLIALDAKGGCSVHLIDGKLMDYGLEEYERLVQDFNKCILQDKFNESYEFWSQRYDGVFVAEKPNYLY